MVRFFQQALTTGDEQGFGFVVEQGPQVIITRIRRVALLCRFAPERVQGYFGEQPINLALGQGMEGEKLWVQQHRSILCEQRR